MNQETASEAYVPSFPEVETVSSEYVRMLVELYGEKLANDLFGARIPSSGIPFDPDEDEDEE